MHVKRWLVDTRKSQVSAEHLKEALALDEVEELDERRGNLSVAI